MTKLENQLFKLYYQYDSMAPNNFSQEQYTILQLQEWLEQYHQPEVIKQIKHALKLKLLLREIHRLEDLIGE